MTNKIETLSKGFYTTGYSGDQGYILINFGSLADLHAADDELRALLANHTEEPLGVVEPYGYWIYPKGNPKLGIFHHEVFDTTERYCEVMPLYTSPPAPVAVVLPSPAELRALVTEAARDSDLIAGANYYTAAELAANYMLSKIKELNP